MRAIPAVREAPDLPTLVRSGLEAQSTMGNSIRIPSEHASPEDRAAFLGRLTQVAPELVHMDLDSDESRAAIYERLGRPTDAAGYTAPDIVPPNGVDVDLAGVDGFRAVAHKHGLTDQQFQGVVADITNERIEAAQAQQAERAAEMGALADDWGYAFDANLANVRQFARASGAPEEFLQALDKNRVGAATLRWMHSLASNAGEGVGAVDNDGPAELPMTAVEAQRQVNEILANKEHAYWNRQDPRHDEAVQEYLRLNQIAAGPDGRGPQSPVPMSGAPESSGGQGIVSFEGNV